MGKYLTADGFEGKTQAEIINELGEEWKIIHGQDVDLDASSGFGQNIGVASKMLAQPWDALKELFNGFDPTTATGNMQEKIVAINNITRLPATSTYVNNVLLEGTEMTIIPINSKAKQPFGIINYSLVAGITITRTVAAKGVIEVDTVTVGTDYTVVINAVAYTHTAVMGNTKTDILDAIETLITAGSWAGVATVANEQLTIYDIVNNFNFNIAGLLLIEETWSKGNFTADIAGKNTCAANSLTEIVTGVVGWDAINNPSVGSTGREIETHDELRVRRDVSMISGNATDEALRSKLFQQVEGVANVMVKSNRTDFIDVEGRDPHSFECVVEGALDTDIAQKILELQPSGINSFGSTTVIVFDSQGYAQPVRFSRPENIYIFVRVRRNLYTEEVYPVNGDELIKEAIVEWSLLEFFAGKDVIRQRISKPIYTVAGIKDIEITLDYSNNPLHIPAHIADNVSIDDRQIAVFTIGNIIVELLP